MNTLQIVNTGLTKSEDILLVTLNENHNLVDSLPYVETYSDEYKEIMKNLIAKEMASMKPRNYLEPLYVPSTELIDQVFQLVEDKNDHANQDESMKKEYLSCFKYNWQVDLYNICTNNSSNFKLNSDIYFVDEETSETESSISCWDELNDLVKKKVEHSKLSLKNLDMCLMNLKENWNQYLEVFQKYEERKKKERELMDTNIITVNKRRKLNQVTESNYFRILTTEYTNYCENIVFQGVMLSGSENGELLIFRTRLCGITTEAQNIKDLSCLMRQSTDPKLQGQILQIWLANIKQTTDSTRLLALIYLANDVIQLLRGDESRLIYRYKFAFSLAEAIVYIRQQVPSLISKIDRILSIFKERIVYDCNVISLLQECTSSNIDHVVSVTLSELLICTTIKVKECIEALEKEISVKSASAQAVSVNQNHSNDDASKSNEMILYNSNKISAQAPIFTNIKDLHDVPSSESFANIGKYLRSLLVHKRSEKLINIDADILSRMRNYRIPTSAPITESDKELLKVYKFLLMSEADNFKNVTDKVQRRKVEESNNHYFLTNETKDQSNLACASKRIEILLRKEWNLRCKSARIEHALYWHLFSMLHHLINRWKKMQLIIEGVETEKRRRSEVDKSIIL